MKYKKFLGYLSSNNLSFPLESSGHPPLHEPPGGESAPRGWRSEFADRWPALARARALREARGRDAVSWARSALAQSGGRLERLVSEQRATGPDHEDCFSCGVAALEACAAAWGELAPVGGQRQMHLVRRLEQRLEREEADVLSGQADYVLRQVSVRIALTRALEAIEGLKEPSEERAEALEALEDASVSLAAIAVRAALNIKLTGTASADGPPLPGGAASDLDATAGEIAGKASVIGVARRAQGGEPNAGSWLSEALVMRLPPAATRQERDPTLRAESLFILRSRWLRLGALALLMLEAMDEELVVGVDDSRREMLRTELAERAAKLLRRGRLASRPSAFDFGRAWERQLAALGQVVDTFCRGLGGDRRGLERARWSVMAALVRVATALWLIDAKLGGRQRRRTPAKGLGDLPAHSPRTYEERLAEKVTDGGAGAVEAALELLERREPATFSEAVKLVCVARPCAGAAFDAIADAWETYQVVRYMPWD